MNMSELDREITQLMGEAQLPTVGLRATMAAMQRLPFTSREVEALCSHAEEVQFRAGMDIQLLPLRADLRSKPGWVDGALANGLIYVSAPAVSRQDVALIKVNAGPGWFLRRPAARYHSFISASHDSPTDEYVRAHVHSDLEAAFGGAVVYFDMARKSNREAAQLFVEEDDTTESSQQEARLRRLYALYRRVGLKEPGDMGQPSGDVQIVAGLAAHLCRAAAGRLGWHLNAPGKARGTALLLGLMVSVDHISRVSGLDWTLALMAAPIYLFPPSTAFVAGQSMLQRIIDLHNKMHQSPDTAELMMAMGNAVAAWFIDPSPENANDFASAVNLIAKHRLVSASN